MTTETLITIDGKSRDSLGKNASRKIRRGGLIPAIICGGGKTTHLSIDPKWLAKAWKGTKTFNLNWEGKTQVVSISELQLDHIKRVPLHVELAPVK